jgi:hypothetical protein
MTTEVTDGVVVETSHQNPLDPHQRPPTTLSRVLYWPAAVL